MRAWRMLALTFSLLAACKSRSYATAEGTASVLLTPIDGEGYTIEAEGVGAYATDSWNLQEDEYDTRIVDIRGMIAPPGPCFADGEAWLEIDLYDAPQVHIEVVPVGPESVLGSADEEVRATAVDAWSGDYVGEVEFYYGDDSPCALPATRHQLEVHWTLEPGSWTEVKMGPGDLWPPVPAG